MDISVKESDEGVFLYIPDFKYGKGFALPYGPISDDILGLNIPEYGPQTLNEVRERLDELNLIKPSSSQLVHLLSFIPFIPDERIQSGLVSMLRQGLFSFDRCFLGSHDGFYLARKGSYNGRGPFLDTELHDLSRSGKSVIVLPFRERESFCRRRTQKIEALQYGVDEISDFLLGRDGIDDLKAFLSYSTIRVLEVNQPRGNSEQKLEEAIGNQLIKIMIEGFPPYYNEFQPSEFVTKVMRDNLDCYIGDSVEGQVFLKSEYIPDYSNRDPDYIPQIDPNAAVILNIDFYKDLPEDAQKCYSVGIIR